MTLIKKLLLTRPVTIDGVEHPAHAIVYVNLITARQIERDGSCVRLPWFVKS